MSETIALQSIEVKPNVSIREKLDEDTIQWYMEIFDQLPPIVAYKLDGRLMLADGFHRHAAADRLGLKKITVDVREGTEQEALTFAALANFRHGKSLTLLERDRAIKRLADLGFSQRKIAKEFGLARTTIRNALGAMNVYQAGQEPAQPYKQERLAIAARAPTQEQAQRLSERNDLGKPELQAAVRTLNDPEVSEEYKERMLEGMAPPILAERRVLTGTIEKAVARAKQYDAIGGLWSVLNAISHLRSLGLEALEQQATAKDAQTILRHLLDDIAFLERVQQVMEGYRNGQ